MATEASAQTGYVESLLSGKSVGHVVCVTPARFARLPATVATTFAEISGENCYTVFESVADAELALAAVPAEDRLGNIHDLRIVRYSADTSGPGGPKLNLNGAPFNMRAYCVDLSGQRVAWRHGGSFIWETPPAPPAPQKSVAANQPRDGWLQMLRELLGW